MLKPVVTIVGRPNVGKSTLFNKIIGKRKSIVDNSPGVTRDSVLSHGEWNGKSFIVIDTAGFENITKASGYITKELNTKIKYYVEQANVIIFVV